MRPIATRILPAADTERGENSFIMGPQIIPEELNNNFKILDFTSTFVIIITNTIQKYNICVENQSRAKSPLTNTEKIFPEQ